MKRIELEYKDGNNNAEFLDQVLKEIEKNNHNSYCYLSVIDAIPNDQEQFAEEKGMFSEEVLNLNKMVQNNHGIEITFEKLMHVLKKCRTVWD
ncbi:hypothetical protein, partial [Ligilactobacillus salivarius]|uniref:hypothetical protein n=1 Tax=Ligilactobacillus salivarius TaxID=1624 RepID=UPI0023B01791